MTTQLSEALADLAGDVDRGLSQALPAQGLAATTWTRGRRARRRVRAVRVTLAAAAVVAVVAAVVPGSWDRGATPAGSADTPALGHPVRIAKPWTTSDLPARGEPLAGVAVSEARGYAGWYAVTQDGGVRRLPITGQFMEGVVPTLSADGRLLGYLDSGTGRYALHDVVTGRVTSFPDVGTGSYPDPQHEPTWPYGLGGQAPGYTSPDGTHVVLPGATTGARGTSALLVLGTDGSVRPIAVGAEYGLVGWLDNRTLLAMDSKDSGPDDDRVSSLTPVALGLDGTVRRLPTLRSSAPISAFGYTQWSPALSPDRHSLAIGLGGRVADPASVLVFDLASGRELESTVDASPSPSATFDAALSGLKHVEWRGSTWYAAPAATTVRSLVARRSGVDPVVVVDPRLELAWLDLADDALAGPARGGPVGTLLGTHSGWVAWHWRELLIGAAVVLLLGLSRRWLKPWELMAPGRTGDA